MTLPILIAVAKTAAYAVPAAQAAAPLVVHKTDPLVIATWALVVVTLALVAVTAGLVIPAWKTLTAQTKPVVVPRVMRSELPPRGRILVVVANVGGGAALGVDAVLHFLPFPSNAPPDGRLHWQVRASVIRPGEDHLPTPNGHPQNFFLNDETGAIDNLMSQPTELHLVGTCSDASGRSHRIDVRVPLREGTTVGPAMLVERMSPSDFPDEAAR
jgi:hypothetical protein